MTEEHAPDAQRHSFDGDGFVGRETTEECDNTNHHSIGLKPSKRTIQDGRFVFGAVKQLFDCAPLRAERKV